jgi:hypothetical protein
MVMSVCFNNLEILANFCVLPLVTEAGNHYGTCRPASTVTITAPADRCLYCNHYGTCLQTGVSTVTIMAPADRCLLYT